MSLTGLLLILSPFFIVLLLSIQNIITKRPFLKKAFFAIVLSSVAIIFDQIRSRGPFPGGADIGYGLMMLFSPIVTIPLAIYGWNLGAKIKKTNKLVLAAIGILIIYCLLPIIYIQSLL